jgi:hypothetical protein
MKLEKVKKESQVVLDGIDIEVTMEGSEIKSVVLTDKSSAWLRIEGGSTYSDSINVYVKAPPKKEKRWFVVGSVVDVPVCEGPFETYTEANTRLGKFLDANLDQDVEVEEREVEVE